MENFKKILIDVSELEAPEPLALILESAKKLSDNEILIIKHRLNPVGLYPHLIKLELLFSTKQINQDEFEIKIWK